MHDLRGNLSLKFAFLLKFPFSIVFRAVSKLDVDGFVVLFRALAGDNHYDEHSGK